MEQLDAFQRDVLYVIAGSTNPSGKVVQTALEQYYSKNVSDGRLYRNLDALVEMGYLEKSKQTDRMNRYSLTDTGVQAIKNRAQWRQGKLADATLPSFLPQPSQ